MPEEIVQGWTEPMDFILKYIEASDPLRTPQIQDLSGMTVTSVAYDRNEAVVTLNGTTSVVAPAEDGHVRYVPSGTEFTKALSPYAFRFKVTDVGGKVAYFPSGLADTWIVRL
jgi:hypothetical protein